jgi:hypothetical protein
MKNSSFETTLNLWLCERECEVDVVVYVTDFHPGTPGKYTGLPENCYPAEEPEWDDVLIYMKYRGKDIDLPWQFIECLDIDDIIIEKCMEEIRDREIAHLDMRADAEKTEKMIRRIK